MAATEALFTLEAQLRQAAREYSAVSTDDTRRALRRAARAYADVAGRLDARAR